MCVALCTVATALWSCDEDETYADQKEKERKAIAGFLNRNRVPSSTIWPSLEGCEVHSMSMEFFTDPWMKEFFGDRSEDFLTMQLEDAICFIPYGTMVDEFQHIIYENPDLTCEERRKVWSDLEKVYKPHLDYEDDPFFGIGGWWQRQAHIFQMPFYYIDYVLASICAMQFKVMMDEDYKKAWENYLKLCKLSARDFFVNMIKEVGLNSPFEDGCIEALVRKLE